MKKFVLVALMLTSLTGFSQEKKKDSVVAENKWRTLTFGSTTGSTVEGRIFTQGTVSLDYELNNNFFISSWNGLNYNFEAKGGWFSSQTTIDKRWNKFLLGAGLQYGGGYQPSAIVAPPNDNLYFIIKLQYRIKL